MNTADVTWNPDGSYILSFLIGEFVKNVDVKDFTTSQAVSVAGMEGSDGSFMQSAVKGYYPLEFGYISSYRADSYETNQIDTLRLSSVAVSALFSDATATVTAHQVIEDKNGIKTAVKTITIPAINHDIGDGNFYGVGQNIDTSGAYKVSFIVEAPTAGTASFIFGAA